MNKDIVTLFKTQKISLSQKIQIFVGTKMNTKTNTFIFIHEIDSILFMYIKSVQRQLLFFQKLFHVIHFREKIN